MLVDFKKVKEVAKEFRVTVNTVNILVAKARKNTKFITTLFGYRDLFTTKEERIKDVIEELVA